MIRLDNKVKISLLCWWATIRPFSRYNTYIGKRSRLLSKTIIGDGSRINGSCYSKGNGLLTIGKYCAIGENVRFITSNHDMRSISVQYALQREIGFSPRVSKKIDVTIGSDVWVGDNAVLLPGITVASGAVIGAGSIVTKNVEPYSIVAGNPAKVIGHRATSNVTSFMLELAWWNWEKEKILNSKAFFNCDLGVTTIDELQKMLQG